MHLCEEGGQLELKEEPNGVYPVCHCALTRKCCVVLLLVDTSCVVPSERLPRVIGLKAAVPATLTGKPFNAKQAAALGLVDAVVKTPQELLPAAGKLALDIAEGRVPRRITSKLTNKIEPYEFAKAVIEGARAQALAKNRNLPQPFAYLEAAEEGAKNGFDAGLAKEQALFAGLVLHPVSKALVHFFFASRATTKGLPTKLPAGVKPIQTVAVLGGGTMGAGICIAYLLRGYKVRASAPR